MIKEAIAKLVSNEPLTRAEAAADRRAPYAD